MNTYIWNNKSSIFLIITSVCLSTLSVYISNTYVISDLFCCEIWVLMKGMDTVYRVDDGDETVKGS